MPVSSILYVFPHPDDESFGPAPIIAKQRREEHDVHLLTLTRGEATSQRQKYGYSKDKMGKVRRAEMQDVARVLDLSSLKVLDFPDGGLDDLNPTELEEAVTARIRDVQPDVVVTYAVHGISGHPDHLVAHAVVKRVYCAMEKQAAPRRLAFFTLPEKKEDEERPEHLRSSPDHAIDVVVRFEEEDRARAKAALDCYTTYQDVIARHQPLRAIGKGVHFELFQEAYAPPLNTLTQDLGE